MKRILPWVLILFLPIALGSGERESRWVTVKVTAYCPCKKCCGPKAHGKTATGRNAYLPGVAVDAEKIPLGSRLDIPNYPRGPNKNGSWILADDTGSKVKGLHIDVRFDTHKEALDWAAKHPTLKVRIWSNP